MVEDGIGRLPRGLRSHPRTTCRVRALDAAEWTEVFSSERLTGALLDRLTHRVHILEMHGDSYRHQDSRQSAAALAPPSDRPAAD